MSWKISVATYCMYGSLDRALPAFITITLTMMEDGEEEGRNYTQRLTSVAMERLTSIVMRSCVLCSPLSQSVSKIQPNELQKKRFNGREWETIAIESIFIIIFHKLHVLSPVTSQ